MYVCMFVFVGGHLDRLCLLCMPSFLVKLIIIQPSTKDNKKCG